MGRKLAICVGINDYKNLTPLKYAQKDAKLIRDYCHTDGGFKQVYFFTQKAKPIPTEHGPPLESYPTFGNLKYFLRKRFEQPFLGAGDTLWFFFAGHGKSFENRDYLIPIDGDPENVEQTGLAVHDIAKQLRGSGAENIILIIDACRSEGSRSSESGLYLEKQPGVITLFSCSPNEFSYEIRQIKQGSFSYTFLQWFHNQDNSSVATFRDLYDYLREQVPKLNKHHKKAPQTPYAIADPAEKIDLVLFAGIENSPKQLTTLIDGALKAERSFNYISAMRFLIDFLELSPENLQAMESLQRVIEKRVDQLSADDSDKLSVNVTAVIEEKSIETEEEAIETFERSVSWLSNSKPIFPSEQSGLNLNSHILINRELNWLEFNFRVMSEATEAHTPLLEKLKFLSIFSKNLDEFFMVRVSRLKRLVSKQVNVRGIDGLTPLEQLQHISQKLRPMVARQHQYFEQELRSRLKNNGIHILNYQDLTSKQVTYLQSYFEEQIFPVLVPLAMHPGDPFPYISNLSSNFAVVIRSSDSEESHFALVKVPKVLSRFVRLPETLSPKSQTPNLSWVGVPIEQIIGENFTFLFPGVMVEEYYTFRITRDADLSIEEDGTSDLMLSMEQELRRRRLGGAIVRMELQTDASAEIRTTLLSEIGLNEDDVYDVPGLIGLGDLISLLELPLPKLKDPAWSAIVPSPWSRINRDDGEEEEDDDDDIFSIIRRRDRLVHHPYTSFTATVQQFITQAAADPDVLAIKITLYRTSANSPIINALISAAENGKEVTALVELKARFDEENNINWARTLEKAGVHVIYGLIGLKTHTKTTVVVRKEHDGVRRYVHIGTGNYNSETAKLYTDLGLLSCCEELGADLTDLFNYVTGYSRQNAYRKLLVAPITLRSRIIGLIDQEIAYSKQGGLGKIIAKMNSLQDAQMIQKLYEASCQGVQIDLIVRGICCLRPGVKDLSENIRVISVIGRFLEHTRVFYFRNGGDELFFIGSADWMTRNLDFRVEAVVPIEANHIKQELSNILNLALQDNCQAWDMQPDGSYVKRRPQENESRRGSQMILMEQALPS